MSRQELELERPIIENVPLARAVAQRVARRARDPGRLYVAVAELLAMVYRLKNRSQLGI